MANKNTIKKKKLAKVTRGYTKAVDATGDCWGNSKTLGGRLAGICSSNYSHCGSREDGDKCRQAPAKPPNDSANKQIGIMNTQKAARCVIVSWLRPCVGIRSDSFDEHFPCRGCCKFKRLKRPERLNVPHNCVKMQQNVAASQREASIFFFMVVKPPTVQLQGSVKPSFLAAGTFR